MEGMLCTRSCKSKGKKKKAEGQNWVSIRNGAQKGKHQIPREKKKYVIKMTKTKQEINNSTTSYPM